MGECDCRTRCLRLSFDLPQGTTFAVYIGESLLHDELKDDTRLKSVAIWLYLNRAPPQIAHMSFWYTVNSN